MNASDFIVKDGTLIRYEGKERQVCIPSGVTRIAPCAFGSHVYPSAVEKITLPDTVTALDHSAFAYCVCLREIVLACDLSVLPFGVFRECRSLRALFVPPSVKVIEKEAFCGCSALAAVVLPEGLTEIGEGAFLFCKSLTRVSLPASLRTLGANAFLGCTALYDVRAREGLLTVGAAAFSGCTRLAQITLPASVEALGARAFYGCTALLQITLASARVSLGASVFDGVPSPLALSFGGDAATWEEMIRPTYVAPEYETMYGERGSYTKCYPLGHAEKEGFVCHVRTQKDGASTVSYGHAHTEDGGVMH